MVQRMNPRHAKYKPERLHRRPYGGVEFPDQGGKRHPHNHGKPYMFPQHLIWQSNA